MTVIASPSLRASARSGLTPSSMTACTASGSTRPVAGSSASAYCPTCSVWIACDPCGVATCVPAGKQVQPPTAQQRAHALVGNLHVAAPSQRDLRCPARELDLTPAPQQHDHHPQPTARDNLARQWDVARHNQRLLPARCVRIA